MAREAEIDGISAAETQAAAAADQSESPGAAENPEAGHHKWRRRVTWISLAIVVVTAAVVIPPLVNVGRYQARITALMSRSLGRPVHLSSVGVRLLPRPGFILNNLSVGEDESFGVEPMLSAQTVVASIRILSLWRGELSIDRISVDEASLNLVRSPEGRWNLESLMLGAQPVFPASAGASSTHANTGQPARLPYLEATNSRVNLKFGVEKSPYSLTNTDLSLWQDQPGHWRLRLRGQPIRTDLEMSPADTGELRVEASMQSAGQLRDAPVQLQAEWREAQLGQLSRLVTGSDAGWRGDLTADIEVHGTPESALTKARLRATSVRREEFAPETPLDLDANCSFRYQHSENALHDIGCDTAVGNGRLHLKAELPGNSGKRHGMLEVTQVPLQAGLDVLRTVRGGFAPGIQARGTANGSLTYQAAPPAEKKPQRIVERKKTARSPAPQQAATDLQGSITLDGAVLRGGGLKEPLILPKMTWKPILLTKSASGSSAGKSPAENPVGLGTQFTMPLSPSSPAQPSASPGPANSALTIRLNLGAQNYESAVTGTTGIARLRDLAYAFGSSHMDAIDSFVAGTADVDFSASGPWIPSENPNVPDTAAELQQTPAQENPGARPAHALRAASSSANLASADSASIPANTYAAVFQLHRAQWKPAYLSRPVDLAAATLSAAPGSIKLNADFSYGTAKAAVDSRKLPSKELASAPENAQSSESAKELKEPADAILKGSVKIDATRDCPEITCRPQVQLHFTTLDTAQAQAALLGAPERKSLLSPILDRIGSSSRTSVPAFDMQIQADTLILGPTTASKAVIHLHTQDSDLVAEHWEASLLEGSATGTGRIAWTSGKPSYSIEGTFTGLSAASLAEVFGTRWSGGPIGGQLTMQTSGQTQKELETSAAGNLRFDWSHGVIETVQYAPASSPAQAVSTSATPAANVPAVTTPAVSNETRFDNWSGTIAIQGGKAQLGENTLVSGRRSASATGSVTFGAPVKLAVGAFQATAHGVRAQSAAQPAAHPAGPASPTAPAPLPHPVK